MLVASEPLALLHIRVVRTSLKLSPWYGEDKQWTPETIREEIACIEKDVPLLMQPAASSMLDSELFTQAKRRVVEGSSEVLRLLRCLGPDLKNLQIAALCGELVKARCEVRKLEASEQWMKELREEGARCGDPFGPRLMAYRKKQEATALEKLASYSQPDEQEAIAVYTKEHEELLRYNAPWEDGNID